MCGLSSFLHLRVIILETTAVQVEVNLKEKPRPKDLSDWAGRWIWPDGGEGF